MPETRVKSLPATAYAIATGAKLLRCEAIQPNRADFILETDLDSAEITREFFTGAEVSARDYYRALQDVRFAVKRLFGNGGAR